MESTTYQGSVRWRESYTCWGCASKYQATFTESVAGTREAVAEAVRQKRQPRAGAVPCPLCAARGRGSYLKDAADLFSGMPIVLALLCGTVAALAEFHVLASHWAAAIAAAFCAAFALGSWRLAMRDPNRDLSANRHECERLIQEGILELQVEGNPNRSDAPVAVAAGWKSALLVLPFAGALVCLLPIADVVSISIALIAGPLLAIGSFAGLAYDTARLYGAESLTACDVVFTDAPNPT